MSVKQDALALVAKLPENVTWEEIRYQVYVRSRVDAGLNDLAEGNVVSHEQIKKEFGVE